MSTCRCGQRATTQVCGVPHCRRCAEQYPEGQLVPATLGEVEAYEQEQDRLRHPPLGMLLREWRA